MHEVQGTSEGRNSPAAARDRAGSGSSAPSAKEANVAKSMFARLCSQLISTHEEIRFGADELGRLLMPIGGISCGTNSLVTSAGVGGLPKSEVTYWEEAVTWCG